MLCSFLCVIESGADTNKGLLVPTGKKHHPSLQEELPELRVHTILGKWLYLPEEAEDFEEIATKLVDLITEEDPRVGVLPKPRWRVGVRSQLSTLVLRRKAGMLPKLIIET